METGKSSGGGESPMLQQYRRIKKEHSGEVLFFRLGDFYEMFADDAVEVSGLLNLTLTSRNGLPMCGVPYHASRVYIARLLKVGKKVAICEQLSEPLKGKALIEREVVEVITPGTTVDEDFLDKGSSNYLACLFGTRSTFSFAYIELSTGEFCAASFPAAGGELRVRQELERLQVREIIVEEALLEENAALFRAVNERNGLVVNRWTDWLFDAEKSRKRLCRQFGVESLKGFGLSDDAVEIISAGALLDYLDGTAKTLIPQVTSLRVYGESEFMGIDEATQRNLELVRNLHDGGEKFTLLEVLDETRTAMGRRLLKHRITHPLLDTAKINARLAMTEHFYRDQHCLTVLREILGKTPDLQRLSSRLAMDKAHGKDMLALKNALAALEKIFALLNLTLWKFEDEGAASLGKESAAKLFSLSKLLECALFEDPSILLTEGKLIRAGYNADLDRLVELRDNGRLLLEDYLEEEKQKTGISSLKIHYNRLIGYYFEVTKIHLSRVPDHFIKRQGLSTGERYSTVRLAGLESDINGASDKIIELEKKLFLELRERAKALLGEMLAAAALLAELDVAQSLARAAAVHGWSKSVVNNKNRLKIIEARHPVVEAHLSHGEFIPNDVILDAEEGGAAFVLITGPNMAGKSTYLRQAALIIIMAQMGSYVSAAQAELGLVDRVYCRVGASDNLARGESTFLVEMNETAYILNTATSRSLVIMDEVGRGTSTKDGLAIAQAVSEDLLNRLSCRTLFATHYHELSALQHPRLVNRSLLVDDTDGEIVFRRRLVEGPSPESYGLHVARLAGLSTSILERAACIMRQLQDVSHKVPPVKKRKNSCDENLSLFDLTFP